VDPSGGKPVRAVTGDARGGGKKSNKKKKAEVPKNTGKLSWDFGGS